MRAFVRLRKTGVMLTKSSGRPSKVVSKAMSGPPARSPCVAPKRATQEEVGNRLFSSSVPQLLRLLTS